MPTKMDRLQERVRQMESVASAHGDRDDRWMNAWAFQVRRELRRRSRKAQAARAAGRPQPSG
ncbi:MAG TPA: hypothetical protein VHR88_08515 [Solirubrobacteraceae bacterium]|jgi:hypothetical protein|nr:hypothetical protein [Solirubrobacteraceae bacterium]